MKQISGQRNSETGWVRGRSQEKNRVIFTKKNFRNSSQIINYLSRYSHRVAISNSRILSFECDQVIFSMKDYRDGRKKTIQLHATEFIRRFLLHVLPKSFCKNRYYGLFDTRNRNTVLSRCRIALRKPKIISRFTGLTWQQLVQMITCKDIDICPVCQALASK